jgi:hypothetical protein
MRKKRANSTMELPVVSAALPPDWRTPRNTMSSPNNIPPSMQVNPNALDRFLAETMGYSATDGGKNVIAAFCSRKYTWNDLSEP